MAAEKWPLYVFLIGIFSTIFLNRWLIAVPSGHVGVVTRFGKVLGDVLTPGLNTKNPIYDKVRIIDCRIQSKDDESSAFSNDLQVVATSTSMQYSLEPSKVADMYRSIGTRHALEEELIEKAVSESIKAVTTNFTAQALITNRPLVKNKIIEFINTYMTDSLIDKQLNGLVKVANIALTNFQFSHEFSQAIEDKVRAEQEALKAEQEKVMAIVYAEAAEAEEKIRADAEAYRISALATARADAIEAEAAALDQQEELLDLRALEKWNGELPEFMSNVNDDDIPFIGIDN